MDETDQLDCCDISGEGQLNDNDVDAFVLFADVDSDDKSAVNQRILEWNALFKEDS